MTSNPEPGSLSRLDAYRALLGFLALVLGLVILYRSLSYPTFGLVVLGLCLVVFGVVRLKSFFRWLNGRFPRK